MAAQLNPYLQFNNTAREAMEFYASVLGGTPEIMTFGDMDPNAGDIASGVMHAYLETPDGFALMASDTPPGMPLREGSAISVRAARSPWPLSVRCGATSSGCSPTSSGLPGWSTSPPGTLPARTPRKPEPKAEPRKPELQRRSARRAH